MIHACCLLILLCGPAYTGPQSQPGQAAESGDATDGRPPARPTRRRPFRRLIDAISARFRQTIDHTIRSTANAVMPWILLALIILALLSRR